MDIYETTLMCNNCNKETSKTFVIRDGFKIRAWQCPSCHKTWPHPSDLEDYKRFLSLKKKNFQVKLRMVGNSYTVSIPREIIEFTEIRQEGHLVDMSLDEPEKLTLFFKKITRKRIY